MPVPAGTGPRPPLASCCARRARRSRSTAPAQLADRRLRGRDRAAPQAAGRGTVLLDVFLDGGVDALSVLSPVGDPLYRKLRPKLALPDGAGTPFAEDARLRWHPSRAGLARRCTARARSPCCRRSATRTRTSRTSRRATSGRSARPTRSCAPAGSAATSTASARPTTRCRASRSTGSSQPSLATARVPVAALDSADDYGFWTPGVWGVVEDADAAPRSARSARAGAARPTRASRRPPARSPSQATRCAAARRRSRKRRQAADTPGAAYPTVERRVPAAARRPRGDDRAPACRSAASRSTRPGAYDTHANQAKALADEPEADRRLAARVPARPRGARARRPRARRSSGRSSAAAPQENGSAGTDHGAAGIGFLIGTRAAGTDGRRVPGARRSSTTTATSRATVRLPRRLRRAARAVARHRRCGDRPGRVRLRAAEARPLGQQVGDAAVGDVDHVVEAAAAQQRGGERAAVAGRADDGEGAVAGQLGQPVPQLVVGDVQRAVEVELRPIPTARGRPRGPCGTGRRRRGRSRASTPTDRSTSQRRGPGRSGSRPLRAGAPWPGR